MVSFKQEKPQKDGHIAEGYALLRKD